jgi:hypothetical protein
MWLLAAEAVIIVFMLVLVIGLMLVLMITRVLVAVLALVWVPTALSRMPSEHPSHVKLSSSMMRTHMAIVDK